MIDSPLAFPNGAYGHPGMTLRDYFAAAAMQGIVSTLHEGITPSSLEIMCEDAYEIADAMLEARGE